MDDELINILSCNAKCTYMFKNVFEYNVSVLLDQISKCKQCNLYKATTWLCGLSRQVVFHCSKNKQERLRIANVWKQLQIQRMQNLVRRS